VSFHGIYERVLGFLALVLVLNGIDDLVPPLICLWNWFRPDNSHDDAPERKAQRRLAIFVPCWREADVIGQMVRHNIAAIKYPKYDFFLGVYPNDEATIEVTRALAAQIKNVHLALCPNNGPTSKADCLNAIYQRMLEHETQRNIHFDTVVIHDAEDLIHPEAFDLINRERVQHDMVQVPVLPLPTPPGEFTHGVYCDDFAEYQTIDMRARQISRSFIPSNGVGTGYSRKILDRMASVNHGIVFEPSSLTEDYDSGIRIFELGFSQKFCSLRQTGGDYLATREYFPRRFHAAVRQRTRWLMGNALQSWERHGWRGSFVVRYWLWRDRKGLMANPIGLATNILFIAGMLTWCWSSITRHPWLLQVETPWVLKLCAATLSLQCFRLTVRMECVRRIFGLPIALLVPIRSFHANLINALSTWQAIERYAKARMHGRSLSWLKTEHAYPNQESRATRHRSIEEVLVSSGEMTQTKLESIRKRLGQQAELSDYLVHCGELSEEQLSETLGLKDGVPSVYLDPRDISPGVARVLPAKTQAEARVIPFRIERGRLLIAGPQPLESSVLQSLRRFTKLEIEFHLVTWRNFEELRRVLV
jgi:bacteriophage N4 adsorption protein B